MIYSLFFLSVMEKLPATSYVRLVDIWLIFVQLYPFIQGNVQIFKNKIWKYILRLFYSPLLKCMRIKDLPTIMAIQNPYLRDRIKKLYCQNRNIVGSVYHDLLVFQKEMKKIGQWMLPQMMVPDVYKISKRFGKMLCGFKYCNYLSLLTF